MRWEKLLLMGVFLLTFFEGYSQSYMVYEEIQRRKSAVDIRSFEQPFLVARDARHLVTEFKKVLFDTEDLQLYEYQTTDLLNKEILGIVKFKIAYRKQIFDIEVFEMSDGLDDLVVINGNGDEVKVDLKVKVFRGILANEEKSLVSLTFFEDQVSGFISSPTYGDYNIEKLSNNSLIAIYPVDNISVINDFKCGVVEESVHNKVPATDDISARDSNKCVNLYFETRFDIFQDWKSISKVVEYVVVLYTQTESLFYNDGIRTKLSTIRVWDVQDPYGIGFQTTSDLLTRFNAIRTVYNGDLAQLLTYETSGGRAFVGGLCQSYSHSVSGVRKNTAVFPNYSWNTIVISHEFGHLLGSEHTHGCYWGFSGKDVIDGCGQTADIIQYNENCGEAGYNYIGLLPPKGGGTIMSYCHVLGNVGISLNNGFGWQPGNVIRNKVYSSPCLRSCNNCPENLTITKRVNQGQQDFSKAGVLTARNIVAGTAVYTASDYVVLTPGFHAREGSVFQAYIMDCNTSTSSAFKEVVFDEGTLSQQVESKKLILYPNPTTGTFYVTYPFEERYSYYIEIYDIKGKKVLEQKLNKDNNKVFLNQSFKGVYSIRFYENDKVIIDKIILK
ncbi:zinc-dependent metalloprotease [Flavobacterium sp. HSC-61S13]|uniref:zinc-dependent metalloprotease n=1 Tax=Flavobacterium sp. HSC-61S13 TaxID=2910963 RepID=UPI0020A17182|nr:zinc-dependent metalloprotease [Flavobacterium sp. HSC-61S13]MCP1997196.1 hypothetical protein [Flavobacterium sp. HSC-61S13]